MAKIIVATMRRGIDIFGLRAALEADRLAAHAARLTRHRLDTLIDGAVAAGIPYDKLAHLTLRFRLGRAPNARERQREADRLRQRRRRSVTACHGNLATPTADSAVPRIGSSAEVKNMAEKLVKRITTVEEFVDDVKAKDCVDDNEMDEGEDEDDDSDAE